MSKKLVRVIYIRLDRVCFRLIYYYNYIKELILCCRGFHVDYLSNGTYSLVWLIEQFTTIDKYSQ